MLIGNSTLLFSWLLVHLPLQLTSTSVGYVVGTVSYAGWLQLQLAMLLDFSFRRRLFFAYCAVGNAAV
ncbi:hypothetical protein DM860_011532 [Cuscuta australis]|uniref:Nodulin-like domain-containing protein n=1 Tax=Cuscuta australis TaxID=267555 RepID=A0A328D0R2_9ASTE|nr:hypothetical protein DM860_011532 [Cuscuta australis]